jgi:hypothetical protein
MKHPVKMARLLIRRTSTWQTRRIYYTTSGDKPGLKNNVVFDAQESMPSKPSADYLSFLFGEPITPDRLAQYHNESFHVPANIVKE